MSSIACSLEALNFAAGTGAKRDIYNPVRDYTYTNGYWLAKNII
jgi:hypothetical protein